MLNTRYISCSSTPRCSKNPKIGGTGHEPCRMTASQLSGSMRGTLPGSPPPVMCAIPVIIGRCV